MAKTDWKSAPYIMEGINTLGDAIENAMDSLETHMEGAIEGRGSYEDVIKGEALGYGAQALSDIYRALRDAKAALTELGAL